MVWENKGMRKLTAIRIKDLILKGNLTRAERDYINAALDVEIDRSKTKEALNKIMRSYHE